MCRTGSRRCLGSHVNGAATAAARQRKARATKALGAALAAGDHTAAAAARARRDAAAADIAAYHATRHDHTESEPHS